MLRMVTNALTCQQTTRPSCQWLRQHSALLSRDIYHILIRNQYITVSRAAKHGVNQNYELVIRQLEVVTTVLACLCRSLP